jgi:hypothetical protein
MTVTLESFTAFGPMVGHASYVLLVASMMMTRTNATLVDIHGTVMP